MSPSSRLIVSRRGRTLKRIFCEKPAAHACSRSDDGDPSPAVLAMQRLKTRHPFCCAACVLFPKGGNRWAAAKLLKKMRTCGLRPNKFSFDCVIVSCRTGTGDEWRLALELLNDMRRSGLTVRQSEKSRPCHTRPCHAMPRPRVVGGSLWNSPGFQSVMRFSGHMR